jgi:conjugal transfer pilus assembly protein TraF
MKTRKWKPLLTGFVLVGQLSGAVLPAGVAMAEERVRQRAPDAFYCNERKLGTWFYCDMEKREEEAKAAAQPSIPAAARLEAIGKQLDELKAKAILDPSSDNVVAYVRYQREQLDRASTFADVWSRSVWQNPDLDYTLQRPVNTLGKRAWMDQRTADRNSVMQGLSQRYGLFYFYSASCGACEVFSPILKSVSDQYAMSVLPVSMDGGPNSAFPSYVTNSGQYERMGLSGGQVPALVLFDSVTKQPIPIGYGVMSADEIMQRIFVLTKVEPGSDY